MQRGCTHSSTRTTCRILSSPPMINVSRRTSTAAGPKAVAMETAELGIPCVPDATPNALPPCGPHR
eukprot:scaffold276140_cov31-Tisochrysis_lutea.AAC.2